MDPDMVEAVVKGVSLLGLAGVGAYLVWWGTQRAEKRLDTIALETKTGLQGVRDDLREFFAELRLQRTPSVREGAVHRGNGRVDG